MVVVGGRSFACLALARVTVPSRLEIVGSPAHRHRVGYRGPSPGECGLVSEAGSEAATPAALKTSDVRGGLPAGQRRDGARPNRPPESGAALATFRSTPGPDQARWRIGQDQVQIVEAGIVSALVRLDLLRRRPELPGLLAQALRYAARRDEASGGACRSFLEPSLRSTSIHERRRNQTVVPDPAVS